MANKHANRNKKGSGNNGTRRNAFIPCTACESKYNLPKAKVPWIPFFKCYKGMELACPKCDVTWDEIARKQGFTPPNSPFREADGGAGPKNANGESPTAFSLDSFISKLLGKKPAGGSAEAELTKEDSESIALEAVRIFNEAANGERIDMSTAFQKAKDAIVQKKRDASIPPEGIPLTRKEFSELGKQAEKLKTNMQEKKATLERKKRELQQAETNYFDVADRAEAAVNRYKQELLLQARANEQTGNEGAERANGNGRNGLQEKELQEVGQDVILRINPDDKSSFEEKATQFNDKLRRRTEALAALRNLEQELETEQTELRDEAKQKSQQPMQDNAVDASAATKGKLRSSNDPEEARGAKLRRGDDDDDPMGESNGVTPKVLPGAADSSSVVADEDDDGKWATAGGNKAKPPSGSPAAIEADKQKDEAEFQAALAESAAAREASRPVRQKIKNKTAAATASSSENVRV